MLLPSNCALGIVIDRVYRYKNSACPNTVTLITRLPITRGNQRVSVADMFNSHFVLARTDQPTCIFHIDF